MKSVRSLLDGAAAVGMLAASGVLIWNFGVKRIDGTSSGSTGGADAEVGVVPDAVVISDAWRKGNPEAPVVIIEYSEFQCPYCKRFADLILPHLTEEYIDTGKVEFVFRHMPLERLHPYARGAARAAECAGAQGSFWEMHDLLLAKQAELAADTPFGLWFASIGGDREVFDACLENTDDSAIDRDLAGGRLLEISGTPTLLLGIRQPDGEVAVTQRVSGVPAFGLVARYVNELLKQVGRPQ